MTWEELTPRRDALKKRLDQIRSDIHVLRTLDTSRDPSAAIETDALADLACAVRVLSIEGKLSPLSSVEVFEAIVTAQARVIAQRMKELGIQPSVQ
jgi:hypothetical protein